MSKEKNNVFDLNKYRAKKEEEDEIFSLAKIVLKDESNNKEEWEKYDEPIEPYSFKMSFKDDNTDNIVGETEFLFYDTACFLEDKIDQEDEIAKILQNIIIDITCENINYDDIIALSTENISTIYNLFSTLDTLFDSSEHIEESEYKEGYIDALNHILIAMSEAMSYGALNEVISHYEAKENNVKKKETPSNVINLFDNKE